MKKLMVILALTFLGINAAVACRSWVIRAPDGRVVTCLECCDSSGACNVTCQ